MDENQKKQADVSSRLSEAELLKPGTAINPNQTNVQEAPTDQPNATTQNNLEKDVVEFNKFAAAQEEAQDEQNQEKGKVC